MCGRHAGGGAIVRVRLVVPRGDGHAVGYSDRIRPAAARLDEVGAELAQRGREDERVVVGRERRSVGVACREWRARARAIARDRLGR